MTIDQLAKVAGILGFLISVATFALTRWERRAAIVFGFDEGLSDDFGVVFDEPISTINLTITNVGARSLHIDLRTLQIKSSGNALHAWREDHLGAEQREILLKPNDSQVLGIPVKTFRDVLNIKTPKKYDDQSINFMQPLQISVATTSGKVFSSTKLKYWEATGEFHRA
jgi:hypothetical protein